MKFSKREKSMLAVALDCLIVDFRKTLKRARFLNQSAIADCAEGAIKNYTELANKVNQ
jgi:hypothetical protein